MLKKSWMVILLGYSFVIANSENPEVKPKVEKKEKSENCKEEKEKPLKFPRWEKSLVAKFDGSGSTSENWVGAGENTITGLGLLEGGVNYQAKVYSWENKLVLNYGKTKVGEQGFRKSEDKFEIESKWSYKWNDLFHPFFKGKFKTQLMPTYEYLDSLPKVRKSGFMDPAYLTESIGVSFVKVKGFKVSLAGALKQTWANKSTGFADDDKTDEIETFRFEPGIEGWLSYEYEWNKVLKLKTTLHSFSNLKGHKYIDGHWQNEIKGQLTEWFSINASYEILYDSDVYHSEQKKSLISLGLTYSIL